ncbi:hypothetical protein ACMD2_25974 [Ananas comosus]|uniref:Uncharacterized protein n=1 Tax=Ananas comosus TaxID=4615 RepID=A0A199V2X8_ANACO|nr:hypothetical protein ACMD2_25974 [Ananas comosus]
MPEQTGSSEVQELRALMSALVGIVQRQEENMRKLQDLVSQQATTAASEDQAVSIPNPTVRVPLLQSRIYGMASGRFSQKGFAYRGQDIELLLELTTSGLQDKSWGLQQDACSEKSRERVVWQIEALEVDRSCRTAGNQLRRFITSGGCEGEAEVLKFLHCAEFQHRLLAIGIGKENLVKLRIGGCKGK